MCFDFAMKSISLPSFVRKVLDALNAQGFEAYAVGGCVRDALRFVSPHDWDVCTDASPEQVRACLSDNHVHDTGVRYGTVTVVVEDVPVEVTTFRRDGAYTDHRRPDCVTFSGNLADDLSRRDFTVNAMAYHPDTGLVDPFGGEKDLADGVLRCVGDPVKRFGEDALRILRALRFASKLGLRIEEKTRKALQFRAPLLRRIAAERVFHELSALLVSELAEKVMVRYWKTLAVVLPEMRECPPLDTKPVLALRLAALLRGQDAQGILTRFKAPRALCDRVCALIAERETPIRTDADARRLLGRVGVEAAEQVAILQKDEKAREMLRMILARGDCWQLSDLAVTGRDLMQQGFSGKEIGAAQKRLLALVVEGEAPNDRDALLKLAKDSPKNA